VLKNENKKDIFCFKKLQPASWSQTRAATGTHVPHILSRKEWRGLSEN
jgi:hypothetical protein